MASDVKDITINYEEDGVVIVKEIDKEILSKGAWATLIFRYQQWDKAKNAYGADCFAIRRYKKRAGEYVAQGKFNISSVEQAKKIVAALERWIKEAEKAG